MYRKCIPLVFMVLVIQNLYSQNLFSKKNSLDFCEYLIEQELYKAAADELEKVNFLYPGDDRVKFLLLQSYRESENYTFGLKRAKELFSPTTTIPKEIFDEYFMLLTLNGNIDSAKILLNNNFKKKHEKGNYWVHINLLDKKWEKAGNTYNQLPDEYRNNCYAPLIEQGNDIRYKSPFIAGGLSAIVPGAGKVYTGFWRDGLTAFFAVGITGWSSYTGFEKDGKSSLYGWFFGSIATIFYLSNIYGSAKSANYINYYHEEKIIREVHHCMDD